MSGRSYDTPPRNLSSLAQRLRNIVEDGNLRLRARRQIGYMAVIAALTARARGDDGGPIFAIRGGVAIELLIGLQARATKDLDATLDAGRAPSGFEPTRSSWSPRRSRSKPAPVGPSYSTRRRPIAV